MDPILKSATAGIIPLTERNGAPRHNDDKQKALIRAAVESALVEHDNKMVSKLERVIERFENGMGRLMETVEAFRSGDKDVAIANLVDTEVDDLPSVSRLKAAASAVYTMTTSDIADELGLKTPDISYLLNRQGLNWVLRKDELWDRDNYKRTKRRIWHPLTAKLLRDVILDPNHDARFDISPGCERVLLRCANARKSQTAAKAQT